MSKTLGSSSGPVTLALGGGLLGLEAGGRRTTVRLLDVEFVKYRSLLPTSHTTTVEVLVSTLTDAIKRVALVTDRGHHLRLQVAALGAQHGHQSATVGDQDQVPHVEAGEHEVQRDQAEEHVPEPEGHAETDERCDAEAEPAVRARERLDDVIDLLAVLEERGVLA